MHVVIVTPHFSVAAAYTIIMRKTGGTVTCAVEDFAKLREQARGLHQCCCGMRENEKYI
jgi:hypothetical protein